MLVNTRPPDRALYSDIYLPAGIMPDKLYELTTEPRSTYLYARLESEETGIELMIGYGNELAAAVRESGLHDILLENHARILYSDKKYALAAGLFRNLLPGPIRLAIVDARSNNRGDLKQATRAARAAGLNARCFGSVESAEEWLTADSTNP
jgi:hypothetical protein